jgi:hypothetical protein
MVKSEDLQESERFDELSPLTRVHQEAQTIDGLTPDPSCKVLGPKFVGTRRWPSGLPCGLANHPVASNCDDGNFGLVHRIGRYGSTDSKSLIQLLRSFFARRERGSSMGSR